MFDLEFLARLVHVWRGNGRTIVLKAPGLLIELDYTSALRMQG